MAAVLGSTAITNFEIRKGFQPEAQLVLLEPTPGRRQEEGPEGTGTSKPQSPRAGGKGKAKIFRGEKGKERMGEIRFA